MDPTPLQPPDLVQIVISPNIRDAATALLLALAIALVLAIRAAVTRGR